MKLNSMQQNVTQQLINRRTADGRWLQGCDHTAILLNPKTRNKIIEQAISEIKKTQISFDTIACCGISGLLVVPQIAEKLHKNTIVIRKANDKSYSPFHYEGVMPNKYLIIDDLICSGKTVKHILSTIKDDCSIAECLGIYCFLKDQCASRTNPSLCKRDLGINYI